MDHLLRAPLCASGLPLLLPSGRDHSYAPLPAAIACLFPPSAIAVRLCPWRLLLSSALARCSLSLPALFDLCPPVALASLCLCPSRLSQPFTLAALCLCPRSGFASSIFARHSEPLPVALAFALCARLSAPLPGVRARCFAQARRSTCDFVLFARSPLCTSARGARLPLPSELHSLAAPYFCPPLCVPSRDA